MCDAKYEIHRVSTIHDRRSGTESLLYFTLLYLPDGECWNDEGRKKRKETGERGRQDEETRCDLR